MIRYFWKYRFFNFVFIISVFFICILNFGSIKVFFDSERIIELANVNQDIIDKAIDDRNLLLVGIELKDSLSLPVAIEIDSMLENIERKYIKSVRSVFNEKVLVSQLIPLPIKILKLEDQDNFKNSLERIKKYDSRFITSDFKNLLFIIKCQDLDSEQKNIDLLEYLDVQLSRLPVEEINITGQIKSEIYMKMSIINELILFISCSAIICSLVLFYFLLPKNFLLRIY